MKLFTIYNRPDEKSAELKEKLIAILTKKGYIYENNDPELVITVGGDGTVLKAVHTYIDRLEKIKFIGINTGTLGFYTDFTINEVEELVKLINSPTQKIYEYNLIETKIYMTDGTTFLYKALNEFRIENNLCTQIIDVFIGEAHLETFRGNGFCISTPSGSTAYNRSLKGAIVHPEIKCLQLTEIAGIHHNRYRSLDSALILPNQKIITFTSDNFRHAIFGYDNLIVNDIDNNQVKKIECYLSTAAVSFLSCKKISFTNRLKQSFILDD